LRGGKGKVDQVGGIPDQGWHREVRRVVEACWVEDARSCWRSRGVVRAGSGRDDRVGWKGCCWGYSRGLECWVVGVAQGSSYGGVVCRDLLADRFCVVVVIVVVVVVDVVVVAVGVVGVVVGAPESVVFV